MYYHRSSWKVRGSDRIIQMNCLNPQDQTVILASKCHHAVLWLRLLWSPPCHAIDLQVTYLLKFVFQLFLWVLIKKLVSYRLCRKHYQIEGWYRISYALLIMGWQVYRLARLVGKVVWSQHRGTHWWAAPLNQKQQNRSGVNNWLDCLAWWYTSNFNLCLRASLMAVAANSAKLPPFQKWEGGEFQRKI